MLPDKIHPRNTLLPRKEKRKRSDMAKSDRDEGKERRKKGMNAKRREIPITLMGFIFCFVETDNTRKQPFYGGFLLFLLLLFFCGNKKIHSIANKGKYKNYFDTKIIA